MELIVALDVDYSLACKLVDILGEKQVWYKVGYKVFLEGGWDFINFLKEKGKKVFLDLKFCDIPNTMKMAAEVVLNRGVDMFNVHLWLGRDALMPMMEAIWEKRRKATAPKIVGVTALTSQSANIDYVVDMAKVAKDVGMDGVVCSVWEVESIKRVCGSDFVCVCPGVRFSGDRADDQVRVATVEDAKRMGVDYVVMGRSIIRKYLGG